MQQQQQQVKVRQQQQVKVQWQQQLQQLKVQVHQMFQKKRSITCHVLEIGVGKVAAASDKATAVESKGKVSASKDKPTDETKGKVVCDFFFLNKKTH